MKRLAIGPALAIAAFFAATATAAAPVIQNGGFETGDFTGWKLHDTSNGAWQVYSGNPAAHAAIGPKGSTAFPAPPRGTYAAYTSEGGPSTLILTQKFTVPKNAKIKFWTYYISGAQFVAPDDLNAVDDAYPNQQYRVDLMKPSAPLRSLDSSDIRMNLFRTKHSSPTSMDPTKIVASLESLAGKKVVLRFAVADNQEILYAGVDGVKVVKTK
jgi:hypothetical protein